MIFPIDRVSIPAKSCKARAFALEHASEGKEDLPISKRPVFPTSDCPEEDT